MIIFSNFLKPSSDNTMSYHPYHYLVYDDSGEIIWFGKDLNISKQFENHQFIPLEDSVILPGLIDLHTHIPQYPAIGISKGTLLNWLDKLIFPLENKFDEYEYAYKLSEMFFEKSVRFGTTTLSAYSNPSFTGTDAAFEAAFNKGIRAYIGNSLMDINSSSISINTYEDNINVTENLIKKWHKRSDRINYILTPRYALSTSMTLMRWISYKSKSENLLIQTHLSENIEELKLVGQVYNNFNSYTEVYYKAGLINDRCLLAHCIYLNEYEINLIKSNGAGIIHCPSSNRFLQSGIMPYSKYKELGLKIGIGTDVAAGTSLSLFNELKEAMETSKSYNLTFDKNYNILDSSSALYLATKGNAQIIGENGLGDFEKGFKADFISIKLDRLDLQYNEINSENICSKIVYLMSGSKVDSTWINGKKIYGKY